MTHRRSDGAWLMVTLSEKKSKAELEDLLDRMPDEYRGDRDVYPATKAGIVAFIREQREKYWDRATRRPRMQPRALAQITGQEVDEWLATLPPPPASWELP